MLLILLGCSQAPITTADQLTTDDPVEYGAAEYAPLDVPLHDTGCEGQEQDNWFCDLDGDGYGDPSYQGGLCTCPDSYTTSYMAHDCDDSDASISPNAEEQCNGYDDDCDGTVDESVDGTTWYQDLDGDGYGSGEGAELCYAPSGFVGNSDDCDDSDAGMSPELDTDGNGCYLATVTATSTHAFYDYGNTTAEASSYIAVRAGAVTGTGFVPFGLTWSISDGSFSTYYQGFDGQGETYVSDSTVEWSHRHACYSSGCDEPFYSSGSITITAP